MNIPPMKSMPPTPPSTNNHPKASATTSPQEAAATTSKFSMTLATLGLLNSFLEHTATVPSPSQLGSAPAISAVLQQFMSLLKRFEQPISGSEIKQLLAIILHFQPLNTTQSTPLSASFNLLLASLLTPNLSKDAAALLKQLVKANPGLLTQAEGLKTTGNLADTLKQVAGQFQSAQLASMQSAQDPAQPIYFNLPLPWQQQIRRVEVRLSREDHHHSRSQNQPWHLKMLLPVSATEHILADIKLATNHPIQLQFYCPSDEWRQQVEQASAPLLERLADVGIGNITLGTQLGIVPATLIPTHQGELNITV